MTHADPTEVAARLNADLAEARAAVYRHTPEHTTAIREGALVAAYSGCYAASGGVKLAIKMAGPVEPGQAAMALMDAVYGSMLDESWPTLQATIAALAPHCLGCADDGEVFMRTIFRTGVHEMARAWLQLALIEAEPRTMLQAIALERTTLALMHQRLEGSR